MTGQTVSFNNGKDFTQHQCFMEALRCDPENETVWRTIDTTMKAGDIVSSYAPTKALTAIKTIVPARSLVLPTCPVKARQSVLWLSEASGTGGEVLL